MMFYNLKCALCHKRFSAKKPDTLCSKCKMSNTEGLNTSTPTPLQEKLVKFMRYSSVVKKFSQDEYVVTLPKTLCPVCQTNELPVTQNICDSCLEKTMYKTKEHKTKTIKPKPKPGQRKVKFN